MKAFRFLPVLVMMFVLTGCGGNISGSAPTNDGSGAANADPDAGVATDMDDMQKGMSK